MFTKLLLTLKDRDDVRRALLAIPPWITPNGITVFRGVLTLPILLLLSQHAHWLAVLLLAFALILDFVDGALAKVRDMRSETGAFLDPLADKFLICGPLLHAASDSWTLLSMALVITAIAAALTGVRVYKWWAVRTGKLPADTSVAANDYGKIKMVAETVGVLTLLLTQALGSGAVSGFLTIVVFIALSVAVLYASASLTGQLRALGTLRRP